MNYVYIQSEKGLWTVGFYQPDGQWVPESDHATSEAAAQRVHWLNGGTDAEPQYTVNRKENGNAQLQSLWKENASA